MVSAFLLYELTWPQAFWVLAGLIGIGLLLIVFAMDETAYNRTEPANNPPQSKGFVGRIKLLTGITGQKARGRKTIWDGVKEIYLVFFDPHFFLICKLIDRFVI